MSSMDFWVFTHSSAGLEHWFDRYQERFDAWEEGGVTGIVVGYLQFREPDGMAPAFVPNPKIYEERGEAPPAVDEDAYETVLAAARAAEGSRGR